MVGQIYHVGLTVSDLDRSIAFYRDVLEFIKKEKGDLFTSSISELCFYTKDIDALYEHLQKEGVDWLSAPQKFDFTASGFGKSKAFYFRDPDGIILEMMQPL